MKIISNKLKLILVLAFISLASFVFALMPTFMVNAAYYTKTNGFAVSYIGINLDKNNPTDFGNTKFTITFTTELTEDCFDNFTQNGSREIAVGVLVGPNKFVTSGEVTNYQTAIDNRFHPIMNYGTENSGASNLIEFDYNQPFSFEAGVNFNEKSLSAFASKVNGKTADDILYGAASFELAVIPFYAVCNGSNRTPVVNMGDAVSFIAKPYLHEAYVAYTNGNPNAPVVNDYMLQKYITKNNTVSYLKASGEYYINKGLDCLHYAKSVGEDLTYYDAVGYNGMNKGSKDRLYIGGYEFFGETTGLNENHLIDPIPFIDNLTDSEEYTYSITLFKSNGNIVTAKAKCVTSVITTAGTSYPETNPYFSSGIAYTYNNQYFTSRFVNPADENGYPTFTYNGYYVLGQNVQLSRYFRGYGDMPTQSDGVHGFTGVFDGRGKAIYDGSRRYYDPTTDNWQGDEYVMNTRGGGIFTAIEGGTVKNLAIYNTTMGSTSKQQTLIASVINNATIENVYIRPLSYYNESMINTRQEIGYLFANKIENSTLKNVVIENGFLNINVQEGDPEYATRNASGVATFNTIENCTLENVFVAGCSPLSATIINDSSIEGFGVEIGVTELPKLADGSTAKANTVYYFSYPKNATLVEEFKPLVEYIGLNIYNLVTLEQESLFVRFKLMPSEIKTFTTTRELSIAVNSDSNVKNAFINTPYWSMDGSDLVWNVISNYDGPAYGNVVDEIDVLEDLSNIGKIGDWHTLTGIVPYM